MSEEKEPSSASNPSDEQEPFLLTILPFAGLGLLLVVAALWNYIPGGGAPAPSEDPSLSVAERWERGKERDITMAPGRDFVLGPEDAKITLVEFSDFECPYCRIAAATAHDILEKYEGDVRLVFKNYPLDKACNAGMVQPLHTFACKAAALARCAGAQGDELFWETHNALFSSRKLTRDVLDRIPRDLDVSLDELQRCLKSRATVAAVQEDIAEGRKLGVTGTPVFFVNGKKLSDYRYDAVE